MKYTDRTIVCRKCGAEFPFTAGEQAFYESKGIKGEPKLCPECRAIRRTSKEDDDTAGLKDGRKWYPAVCASCGVQTQVPFKPRSDRPVYCKECYSSKRHIS